MDLLNKALVDLQNSIDDLLPKQICETMKLYNHESVIPLLRMIETEIIK